jgi:hypothetical protein
MLSFLKKFFGAKPTVSPCPEVPYKVETPAPVAETAPAVKKVAKKPAVKTAATRKPRTPKA